MSANGATGTIPPLRAVILYAAKDDAFRERFETHLAVFRDRVRFWDVSKLVPGTERSEEIARQIGKANMILLLLSSDFLASEDWAAVKERVREAQRKKVHLFPIRLLACYWEASEFNDIQLLPRTGKEIGDPDNHDGWVKVVQEIKTVVDGRHWTSVPPPANPASPSPQNQRAGSDQGAPEDRSSRITTAQGEQDGTPAGVPPRPSCSAAVIIGVALVALCAGAVWLMFLRERPPIASGAMEGSDAGTCSTCATTGLGSSTTTHTRTPPPTTTTPPTPPDDCPTGMTAVPGGSFKMGGFEGNQTPIRTVRIRAFCLDKTEVTTASYLACVSAGKCPPAGGAEKLCNGPRRDHGEHPINCVRVTDAAAFCGNRGARLPTEAEWEYAARSGEKYLYPWGDEPPDPTKTAAQQKRVCWRAEDTCDVNAHPEGKTKAFDLFGMSANVGEWVADAFVETYDPTQTDNPLVRRENSPGVVRGGSYASDNNGRLRTVYRGQYAPTAQLPDVGFRCAASLK